MEHPKLLQDPGDGGLFVLANDEKEAARLAYGTIRPKNIIVTPVWMAPGLGGSHGFETWYDICSPETEGAVKYFKVKEKT